MGEYLDWELHTKMSQKFGGCNVPHTKRVHFVPLQPLLDRFCISTGRKASSTPPTRQRLRCLRWGQAPFASNWSCRSRRMWQRYDPADNEWCSLPIAVVGGLCLGRLFGCLVVAASAASAPHFPTRHSAESSTMSLRRPSRTQSMPLPATTALATPFMTFHF